MAVPNRALFTWLLLSAVCAGCATRTAKKVEDADKAGRSWAATLHVITEEWAAARVSLRFTRTTVDAARRELAKAAQGVRTTDAAAAARLDRLGHGLDPIDAALAHNDPAAARDAGALLPAIAAPHPSPEAPRGPADIPRGQPAAAERR